MNLSHNKKQQIEQHAREYINSDEFPVIGYPHLAFGDFIKGAECASKIILESMFNDSSEGPFKAKVNTKYHKLGQDCPDDGIVTGWMYMDLVQGEVKPIIFNCPCRWIVEKDSIEFI